MNVASTIEGRRFAGPISIVLVVLAINVSGLVDPMIYHDEAITIQLSAGNPAPDWPAEPDRVGALSAMAFEGSTSPAGMVGDLYRLDVHPPVYFLLVSAWGWLFGHSLEVFRAFSVLLLAVAGLAFRAMLGRLGHPAPTLSSLLFVSFSSVVIVGQAARPYSLNLALLCLIGWAVAAASDKPCKWLGAACVAGCSLAFLTSYLALYPVAVLLLAYSLVTWRKSRWLAVLVPALTAASWLPWLDFVARQSGARPDQYAGFPGWAGQVASLWNAYQTLVWFSEFALRPFVVGLLIILVLAALRRPEDRGEEPSQVSPTQEPTQTQSDSMAIWLLLGWALVPAAGIVAMNVIFDKDLASVRYLVYAAPGVAGLLGYALARIRWLRFALPVWIVAQIFVVAGYNDLANAPKKVSELVQASDSTLVVVSAAKTIDGFTGQVLYELDPDVRVLVIDNEDALEALKTSLESVSEIWLLAPPVDTLGLENDAFRWLISTGDYRVAQANPVLVQLVRK